VTPVTNRRAPHDHQLHDGIDRPKLLEAIMRTNIVMLAVLAGLGLSSFGAVSAEARNLSCISGISPSEQRLLRDCEPKPVEEEIVYVLEVLDPPPARIKHGEGGKGGGVHGDSDHDAPAGGGDPNSAAN
jgi:hypothetical protein